MGIQEGISSDRKDPEHIMETLMLGGFLSDLRFQKTVQIIQDIQETTPWERIRGHG